MYISVVLYCCIKCQLPGLEDQTYYKVVDIGIVHWQSTVQYEDLIYFGICMLETAITEVTIYGGKLTETAVLRVLSYILQAVNRGDIQPP